MWQANHLKKMRVGADVYNMGLKKYLIMKLKEKTHLL